MKYSSEIAGYREDFRFHDLSKLETEHGVSRELQIYVHKNTKYKVTVSHEQVLEMVDVVHEKCKT